jgi:hypothetical protein
MKARFGFDRETDAYISNISKLDPVLGRSCEP